MKLKHILFICIMFGIVGFSWPFTWLFSTPNNASFGTNSWVQNETRILKSQATIDEKVLKLALTAFINTRKHGYTGKQILTVIDYSKPSYAKRMWVFDLKSNRVLFNTWVSHGKNSGGVYATSFSNNHGSLKSSLGVFLTDDTYDGKNGYSLRLRGLERGVNDSAYSRAVVIHGAPYTNAGSVGRSWGCPAVNPRLAKPIINTIKQRSVVFAYYPDRKWLARSPFLNA